jgi:hypothetical protein
MAVILPPQPIGVPPDSGLWNDWYQKLRDLINSGAVTVTWSNIDFTGSNITSIANRAHNNLQSIQGGTAGNYFHLNSDQHTKLTTFVSLSANPTASNIAAGTWAVYKNTTSGEVRLWANDGGVLRSVLLS